MGPLRRAACHATLVAPRLKEPLTRAEAAPLRGQQRLSVGPAAEGRGPAVQLWRVRPGAHILLENQPAGLLLGRTSNVISRSSAMAPCPFADKETEAGSGRSRPRWFPRTPSFLKDKQRGPQLSGERANSARRPRLPAACFRRSVREYHARPLCVAARRWRGTPNLRRSFTPGPSLENACQARSRTVTSDARERTVGRLPPASDLASVTEP